MNKDEQYIMFYRLSDELHKAGYIKNIKYKITKEGNDGYYLGTYFVEKSKKDIDYIIGNIIKPYC